MEFLRQANNPWGQNVLLGIAWNLMWLAVIAGAAFVIGHAIFVRWIAVKPAAAEAGIGVAGIPDRVTRHSSSARIFHWMMSVAMFVLLITAFFPVIGIRFPWVTIHWIAGIGLLITVVYHVIRATFWQDLRSMWFGLTDAREGAAELKQAFGRTAHAPAKTGKYPFDHKMYHHIITFVTLGAIATGLLMMVRVDTPFWARNPYILSDQLWGVVYVVHGVCGVGLITLIMAHIYFAIRPEKLWITRSMIKGWITRAEYVEHFDPERWVVSDQVSGATPSQRLPEAAPAEQQPAS